MDLHSDQVEDVATSSNFKEVKTNHIHLDMDISFDEKKIFGSVHIAMRSQKSNLQSVILDIHEKLLIRRVKEKDGSGDEINYSTKPFTGYGSSLCINLPKPVAEGQEFTLIIDFVATDGPGVCWLDPPQTADKTSPFLYTQGQAVLNRSFFPCQDTPAVKAPYSADVKVAKEYTVIMSAVPSNDGEVTGDKKTFSFKQDVPVQSYLIALAAGNITSREIGPRSAVWAEPSMVEKAQAEFKDVVEVFLKAGESLFGPYVWGRYDILIMPPSFPFGGMENPCLTFVTPCIVVGDKSLTDVVIHEISHSWFGNLVTNANWSEFWLNEGFTMFAQRRIQEKVFGKALNCLEASTGLALLKRHIEQEGNDHPLTKLRVVIEPGVDPDDTYNETPYEKGYTFVCYLQSLVGDVQVFDDFLKAYVENFKYKSIVAEDLFDFFLDYFPKLRENQVDTRQNFEFSTWLHSPGWPPYEPDLSAGSELTEPAEKAAAAFSSPDGNVEEFSDIDNWMPLKVIHFLDKVSDNSPLPANCMQRLADKLPFLSASKNAEITLRWCELVIKNNAESFFPDIRTFLHSQGKQKYTKPLYQLMVKGSDATRALAESVFEETKEYLHQVVRAYVEDILNKQ